MTYIAAFRCDRGIGLCADTQETRGDYKSYVEKLSIIEDRLYPLAIGGAGVADIIDGVTQEIIERITSARPATVRELKDLIRDSFQEFYEKDVPLLVLKKQYRTAEFVIAAKPTNDDFCILLVRARRVFSGIARCIIGYPNSYNIGLLKRLHHETLSIPKGVLLATFLVSQSKTFDEGVGGQTSVVIVRENGAWHDDADDVLSAEKRFTEFSQSIDKLVLAAPDMSITEAQFEEELDAFKGEI